MKEILSHLRLPAGSPELYHGCPQARRPCTAPPSSPHCKPHQTYIAPCYHPVLSSENTLRWELQRQTDKFCENGEALFKTNKTQKKNKGVRNQIRSNQIFSPRDCKEIRFIVTVGCINQKLRSNKSILYYLGSGCVAALGPWNPFTQSGHCCAEQTNQTIWCSGGLKWNDQEFGLYHLVHTFLTEAQKESRATYYLY